MISYTPPTPGKVESGSAVAPHLVRQNTCLPVLPSLLDSLFPIVTTLLHLTLSPADSSVTMSNAAAWNTETWSCFGLEFILTLGKAKEDISASQEFVQYCYPDSLHVPGSSQKIVHLCHRIYNIHVCVSTNDKWLITTRIHCWENTGSSQ